MVVLDGLGDVLGGQYGMELSVAAEHGTFLHNLLHHRPVVCIRLVETLCLVLHLQHVGLLHPLVVEFHLLLVLLDLVEALCRHGMQSHCLPYVLLREGVLAIEVEAQHVAVGDAAGKGVFVQHVAEDHLGGHLAVCVLGEDGCAREAEEHGTGEGVLDGEEHAAAAFLAAARHAAVAFVHDEHHPLVVDFRDGGLRHMVLVRDTAHLLDGGDDEVLVLVVARQHTDEVFRVFGVEHVVVGIGKATVFVCALRAQFYAVEQEHHLVGIACLGYELCRLERGHGLARPRGVPDESATMVVVVPVGGAHLFPYLRHGEILIAAQHLQRLVLVVGDAVVAYQLVCHRDGEQVGSYALPVVHLLVVEVCPMEIEAG